MPILRSIQHSIYCENYQVDDNPEASCNNFIDFQDIAAIYFTYPKPRTPEQHYRKQGYRKINGKWYCKTCTEKLKVSPNRTLKQTEYGNN